MSVDLSAIACPRCGNAIVESASRFCPQCGLPLASHGSNIGFWTALRFVPPLVTLVGSLLAWVRVTALPAGHNGWNVYHFGNAGWGWLAGDIVAIFIVALALARPKWTPTWLFTAWKIYGGLSLGMALSGLVFVSMGSTIAGLVNAPNPLTLSSGVFVFGIGCLAWLVLSFTPQP